MALVRIRNRVVEVLPGQVWRQAGRGVSKQSIRVDRLDREFAWITILKTGQPRKMSLGLFDPEKLELVSKQQQS